MTLREVFARHGLSAYEEAFEREHVAISDLAEMTDAELAGSFGLRAYGDRKRFRAMVADLSGDASAPPGDASAPPGSSAALDSGATRRSRSLECGPVQAPHETR